MVAGTMDKTLRENIDDFTSTPTSIRQGSKRRSTRESVCLDKQSFGRINLPMTYWDIAESTAMLTQTY